MLFKPPSEEAAKKIAADVEAIMAEVIANDPNLRRWIEKCRNVLGPKRDCERDVFGECDKCDRRG